MSTKSLNDVRKGAQQPRVEHVPAYTSTAAQDAIDLMALTGASCDLWQRHVLEGALGERADGRWSSFEVALVVPRQNGKNFILEARELAGLLLFGEKEIIHSAHRLDTARDAFRKFEYRIRETPELLEQVQGYRGQDAWDRHIPGIRTGAGEMSIQMKNGNKISWRTRVGGTGRGFTGDLVIFDEALYLDPEDIAAMMPTMAARSLDGNPQIWYTSSAGVAESEQLQAIRERGMSGEETRLAYFEWSAADDADSDDVNAWYQANPSLGIRISEEYVADTEFKGMEDEQFRRERLGIWAPIGGETAISVGAWKKCLDELSMSGSEMFFAIDVPPSRDSASIAVCSPRPDGFLHVELIDRQVGTSWVAARLAELQERWKPRSILVEAGSAAGALIPDIHQKGVRLQQVTARDYYQACGVMYDMIQQAKIRQTGQEELTEAAQAAQMKFVGDSLFKWNRKNAETDISPLAAVSLAVYGAGLKRRRAPEVQQRSGWRIQAL